MPQQTTGEMGLRMFNDAKAAISMGKMDGLLRRVRHLELRVKYCQHLRKTRKLSLTHWKGEENPSDGLTESAKPLSLWSNLVEAVGLASPWTKRGRVRMDPQLFEKYSTGTRVGYLIGSAIFGIQEGDMSRC